MKYLSLIGYFILVNNMLISQTLLPFAAGTTGNSTWSAGEIATLTQESDNQLITEGFQQPILGIETTETKDGEPPGLAYFTGITTTSSTGDNDFFFIQGISMYPENKLKIVNRWGDLIFETTNYQNDWNGVDQNGSFLPQGTYYYVFSVPSFRDVKGSIHIIR